MDYLLELMQHLLLLSYWKFSEEEQYLIPSMLSAAIVPAKITGVEFFLEFRFIPRGVFERLCCLCVSYSSSLPDTTSPELYQKVCVVDLGAKGLMRIDVKGSGIISITLTEQTEANMVLNFFLSMMRRVQNEFMHGGLHWQVWVQGGDSFVELEKAKQQQLEPWIMKPKHTDSARIDKLLDL